MEQRICHVSTVHPASDARIYAKEALTLARAGYAVTLVAVEREEDYSQHVRVLQLPAQSSRLGRIFGLQWRAWWLALRTGAQAYHLHDPELLPVGIALSIVSRVAVVYDAHEDYPAHMKHKSWIRPCFRQIAYSAIRATEKLAARTLSAVVVPTEPLAERFRRWGAKTVVLRNFPVMEVDDRTLAVPCKQYDVIHVGSLSMERLDFFLRCVAELERRGNSLRWCFLGVTKSIQLWGQAQLASRGLASRVSFLDPVPHSQVGAFLRLSRLGISHHKDEARFRVALPVKVLEYMKEGIPVVASRMPLLESLPGMEKAARLVEPEDARGFSEAIQAILTDCGIETAMGDAGKRAVAASLNWEYESERLVFLYQELLGGSC